MEFVHSVRHGLSHLHFAAQPRVVRQGILPFAPNREARHGGERETLKREEPGLLDQWGARGSECSRRTFNMHDVALDLILPGFSHLAGNYRRRGLPPLRRVDLNRNGAVSEGLVGLCDGIEK